MNLVDMLDFYAFLNDSENMFLMLSDYHIDSRIDRTILNNTILKELGNCRPFTTNTNVFKFSLENFFDKYSTNITKLIDTTLYEYNPLENKDITRTLVKEEDRDSSGDIRNTDSNTVTGRDTDDVTDETQVSAYDSNTYQPKEKREHDETATTNRTTQGSTTSNIVSTVDTQGTEEETIKGKDSDTSYQELIEKERELSEFNIYNWIISQMRKELFLLVY